MKQKTVSKSTSSDRLVKNIRRKNRKIYSAEEKIRIVLDTFVQTIKDNNVDTKITPMEL